ncbi:hypothetical protein ACIOHE_15505 [Streptomyces sp. NPDC087851]|uniref:hypothetical protein n=1 Tax=Streptomyces sp. NPDC087851 TaxID=3365810 RepID=UPI00382CAA89
MNEHEANFANTETMRPECQLGEHSHCDGPEAITAGGTVVLRIHCSCACHQTPACR